MQELLQTAAGVVGKLEEERASVLVSYDSGWDRTTQVINGYSAPHVCSVAMHIISLLAKRDLRNEGHLSIMDT